MQEKGQKIVYAIVQRAGRSIWLRVGRGWSNRDGSLNLELDAIPLTGVLQVRDLDPARVIRPATVPDGRKGEKK